MLKKLVKLNIRYYLSFLIPIYIILMIWTPLITLRLNHVVNVGNSFSNEFLSFLFDILIIAPYIISMIILNFVFIFYIYHQYYVTVISDKSYLIHMFPVSSKTIMFSHSISAGLILLLNLIISILSLTFIGLTANIFKEGKIIFADTLNNLQEIFSNINIAYIIFFIILFIITNIIAFFVNMFTFYLSANISMLSNKNRAIITIITYIALVLLKGTILNYGNMLIIGGLFGLFNDSQSIFNIQSMINTSNINVAINSIISVLNIVFIVEAILFLLLFIILFFINKYLLDKKLNII